MRGGTTTVLLGAAAEQTATAVSAQTTATSEGTPPPSATGTAAPRATATPRPLGPAVHIVTAQGAAGSGPLTATCPADELALTGGWKIDASAHILEEIGGRDGWSVSSSASGAALLAYAVCLQRVTGPSIAARPANVTVAPNAASTVVANCNAGEVLIGGGFLIPDTVDITQFHSTADHSGFSLTVVN